MQSTKGIILCKKIQFLKTWWRSLYDWKIFWKINFFPKLILSLFIHPQTIYTTFVQNVFPYLLYFSRFFQVWNFSCIYIIKVFWVIKRNSLSQKFYKKAALFVLRAIAKHSPELALIVVHNNGLQTIVRCLEDFDPGVKEAAAWALGYIARHNKNLAQAAVDASKTILINVSSIMKKTCLLIKYVAI